MLYEITGRVAFASVLRLLTWKRKCLQICVNNRLQNNHTFVSKSGRVTYSITRRRRSPVLCYAHAPHNTEISNLANPWTLSKSATELGKAQLIFVCGSECNSMRQKRFLSTRPRVYGTGQFTLFYNERPILVSCPSLIDKTVENTLQTVSSSLSYAQIHDLWPFPWKWSVWENPTKKESNRTVVLVGRFHSIIPSVTSLQTFGNLVGGIEGGTEEGNSHIKRQGMFVRKVQTNS